MFSKSRMRGVALIAASLLLAVCGRAEAGKITLAGSNWPVWETARAMDQLGLSKDVNYSFRKYVDSITLFESGKADAILINLYDYMTLCRNEKFANETAIIMVTDFSSGGDVVVTRPDIAQTADLKGKRVGLDIESLSLYLLHLTLERGGMSLSDVELTRLKAEQIDKAFEKSQALVAVAGWNPYTASAIENGGKKLTDSATFEGQIVDVLVVWRSSLEKERQTYKDFVKAWFEARRDPKVLAKMAELNGVDVDEFSLWLGDAKLFDTPAAALEAMSTATATMGNIEVFLTENQSSVPDEIKGNFVPREGDSNLLDVSILEELIQ